jgi:hypothetical protein
MAIEAQRTLVKSVPELWSKLSEADQLGPLLDGAFGEIRITRLEPESLIVWESDIGRGEVELATTGFGTKVRLTAQIAEPEPPPAPPAPSRWRRLRMRVRGEQPPAPPEPEPLLEPEIAERALGALLDEVGVAHHRPFSR